LRRTTGKKEQQMSEPTNDGKQHPDPDPEMVEDVQDEVQQQTPDPAFSDPTAPIWAEPTAPIPPALAAPGAAQPHPDPPAGHQQGMPPAAPPLSNPYAQGPPPPPYDQGPPPASYSQPYPAYSQQPYGSGQHAPANGSAIVLTVVSGVSVVFCNILSIASLVLGIVALTKNATDHEGSRRLTKIGWIVFAAVWGVAILAIIGVIALGALSSNSSPNHMFGN
jgi:hypothetical protein